MNANNDRSGQDEQLIPPEEERDNPILSEAGAEKDAKKPKKRRKKREPNPRRTALIVVASLLVAAALIIPLCFVNWKEVFRQQKYRHISYYPADYSESAFENEEYRTHLGTELSVSLKTPDDVEHVYPFTDLASARAAFNELRGAEFGGGTLGDYFYQLIEGCVTAREKEAFSLLFTEDCKIYAGADREKGKDKPQSPPKEFPAQKVYNIRLIYTGPYTEKNEKNEEICYYRWRVSFEVVRNDGTVLNFTGARDGGEAWFLLVDQGGAYRIAVISGIIQMN